MCTEYCCEKAEEEEISHDVQRGCIITNPKSSVPDLTEGWPHVVGALALPLNEHNVDPGGQGYRPGEKEANCQCMHIVCTIVCKNRRPGMHSRMICVHAAAGRGRMAPRQMPLHMYVHLIFPYGVLRA